MALAMNQVPALLNPNRVRRSGGLGGLGVGLASHDPAASSPAQIAELAYSAIRTRAQGALYGLGFESETPEVRTLPWDVDRPQTKAEKTEQNWERAGMLIGVLGGALGIVLSYQALTGRD